MSHTPKRWIMLKGSAWHVWPASGSQNQHNLIADVRFCGEEGDANARLITVSPEMLATLKAIVANSDESDEWDAVDKLHRNRDAAELIIAKAEGR